MRTNNPLKQRNSQRQRTQESSELDKKALKLDIDRGRYAPA